MSEVLPPFTLRDDVLPADATPLERAIADTDGRLDDIDMDLPRRVKSVDEAPAIYLPSLAFEVSVDVWDPIWPDTIQRAVIRVSPKVHRVKGSPFAVQTALDALGVATEITEWWETAPRGVPYTFDVLALVRRRLYAGPALDARMIGVVYSTVMRTKPVSRAFALRVGVALNAELGMAPAAAARTRVDRPALAVLPVPPAQITLGFAPAAAARIRVAAAAPAALPIPLARAGIGMAAAATARVRIALSARSELPA